MNYSVLVLGASISISLFIRICCSLEANLDQLGDDLFSGRADEVYEKYIKFSLLNGVNERDRNHAIDNVNHIFKSWMQDIQQIKRRRPHWNEAASVKISPRLETAGFNEEICGYVDPPGKTIVDCSDSNGCSSSTCKPEGCDYDQTNLYMGCNNDQLTCIPTLPPLLDLLEMNQTRIQNISSSAFPNVTIRAIRLYRNAIEYIHPWAFHDVNDLSTLLIIGNEITHLAYEIFVGLDNTTFLDLQYNQISLEIYRKCPIQDLEKIRKVLPNLRWLQFSGNPLKTIPRQMFAGLRESPVISLYVNECNLQDIDEEAFTYFKSLKILNLSKNPQLFREPEKIARVLQSLSSLTSLYLQGMGLYEFPVEALQYISHQLTTLDLSYNEIFFLREDVLSMFPKLEELYVDESSIQVVESRAFVNNLNLKRLSMNGNKLRQLPTYFPPSIMYLNISNAEMEWAVRNPESIRFQNMSNLMFLELSKLKIDIIREDTFVGLPKLKSLFINNCNIQRIDDGSFLHGLDNLDVLILDENPISESLHSSTFAGLDKLRTLQMRNSGISFGPAPPNMTLLVDSPFSSLPNLLTLDLSYNSITYLPSNIFQNNSNLCYIFLTHNPIESWESRLFPHRTLTINDEFDPGETCFFEMYLQHGNVHFMKSAMLEDFLRVKKIDFSNNDLVCDAGACELRDLIANSLKTGKQEWTHNASYRCKEYESGKLVYITTELTNEICAKVSISPQPPADSILPSSSKATITIISVMASLSLITAVIIILAYKNRAHLRYFWFTVKFNVMPFTPRKAKLSTMEDATSLSASSYEFDVFISYHHKDTPFIQDVFLPEIELQDDISMNHEVIEAKNSIYLIENDLKTKNNKMSENDNTIQKKSRFKVCLHEKDFAAGVPITDNIVDCVDRSKKTLIFVSRKYMESQWCSYELNLTYQRLVESRRNAFVLVLMEEIPTELRSKILNYLMVSKTHLQWPGVEAPEVEKERFWKRLRVFLQS